MSLAGAASRSARRIVTNPAVKMVSLTGSVRDREGDRAAAAGGPEAGCTWSLAARRRWWSFDDADIERRRRCMRMAAFFNAGQDCTAATRIIATPPVHDALVARWCRRPQS